LQDRFETLNLLEVVVTSGEIGLAKPDPGAFYRFCQLSSVSPEDCVFVDDRIENVRAARTVGMKAHVFTAHSPAATRRWLETSLHCSDFE
jgi:putative hydrolase of the HAD superfamily